MAADVVRKIRIFFSYAQEDRDFRDAIERHLAILKRLEQIITWYDREILPGIEYAQEINDHLDGADIILLLISSHFINSDYCWGKEMKRALERHHLREARVVPILVSPVDHEGAPFSRLQMLPTDGKAITRWTDREDALMDIEIGIRKLVKALLAKKLLDESLAYYNKQNWDEALSVCEKAIQLEQNNPDLYILKGNIFFSQRLYDDASLAYDDALQIDPDSELAHLGKGRVYDQLAQKRYDELKQLADQSYEKARLLKSTKNDTPGGLK